VPECPARFNGFVCFNVIDGSRDRRKNGASGLAAAFAVRSIPDATPREAEAANA
jgi:hypothetical protein